MRSCCRRSLDVTLRCEVSEVECRCVLAPDLRCICIWCMVVLHTSEAYWRVREGSGTCSTSLAASVCFIEYLCVVRLVLVRAALQAAWVVWIYLSVCCRATRVGDADWRVCMLQCNLHGTLRMWCSLEFCAIGVGAMVLECQWAALQLVLWIWIIGALPCTQYPPGAVGLAFIARLCDQLYCAELLWARPGRDLRRGRALRCEVSEMKCRRVLVPDLGYVCIWCIAYQGLTGVSFK